jgi:hypothetical protein
VVICGGGTKISRELESAGYIIQYDEKGRRITKTDEEKRIMHTVLKAEAVKLRKKIKNKKVVVVIPVLFAETILCPINGDDLVKAYELGFDEIFVCTKKERTDKKKKYFASWPKVRVIAV